MDLHVLHYCACLQKCASEALDRHLRALSPEEIADVEQKRNRILPSLSQGLDDPITGNLASPITGAVGGGALGALVGGGLGLGANALVNHFSPGAGIEPGRAAITGAVLGAGFGGRVGYHAKEHQNQHLIDKLREHPEGEATLRNVLTDHYLRSMERYNQFSPTT